MGFYLTEKEHKQRALKRAFYVAKILDDSIKIPFTKWSFGVDALIGIIPIGGDFIGSILSAYILIEARRIGCSWRNILKMLVNLLIDFLVGSIPVVGDVFDAFWKANIRNIVLIEKEIFADRS